MTKNLEGRNVTCIIKSRVYSYLYYAIIAHVRFPVIEALKHVDVQLMSPWFITTYLIIGSPSDSYHSQKCRDINSAHACKCFFFHYSLFLLLLEIEQMSLFSSLHCSLHYFLHSSDQIHLMVEWVVVPVMPRSTHHGLWDTSAQQLYLTLDCSYSRMVVS